MPQPLHMSGAISRCTTLSARSGGTMPDHRQWPGLEATVRHLLFVAVQCKGIEAQFLVPESLIEPFEQCRRLCVATRGRGRACRAHRISRPCAARRHRHNPAIRRALSVPSPASRPDRRRCLLSPSTHVLVADRRTGLILLKSVAIAIAVVVDPRQASLGGLEMPLQQRLVSGCPPGGMQA